MRNRIEVSSLDLPESDIFVVKNVAMVIEKNQDLDCQMTISSESA